MKKIMALCTSLLSLSLFAAPITNVDKVYLISVEKVEVSMPLNTFPISNNELLDFVKNNKGETTLLTVLDVTENGSTHLELVSKNYFKSAEKLLLEENRQKLGTLVDAFLTYDSYRGKEINVKLKHSRLSSIKNNSETMIVDIYDYGWSWSLNKTSKNLPIVWPAGEDKSEYEIKRIYFILHFYGP